MEDKVKHTVYSFTNPRNYKIHCQSWIPESFKATVHIHHGIFEHSGRYETIINFLTNHGYAVFMLDHEAHGLSEGAEEHIDEFNHLVQDAITFAESNIEKFPDFPHFAIGHSMGGLITISMVYERPNLFNGVILSAPATDIPPTISKALYYAGKVVAKILPKIRPVKLDLTTLCRDPEVVRLQQEDKLVWKKGATSKFGSDVITHSLIANEKKESFRSPVLIFHGTGDKVCSAEGNIKFFKGISSEDKTLYILKGWYHEIFNEPEKDLVYNIIDEWISNRIENQDLKNNIYMEGTVENGEFVFNAVE